MFFSAALAIFAMFFGAGNVIFPLLLGKLSGEKSGWAILGLLITAIGGPLLGLFGAILFKGDFKSFFFRCGKVGGYLLMAIAGLLLGPFAVMPRCLVVAHAALPLGLPLWAFSIIATALIIGLILKRQSVLSILGYILSPLLLILLAVIIIRGALLGTPAPIDATPWEMVKLGLVTGYDTMDLIAAIFFSISIWHLLHARLPQKKVLRTTLAAGTLAGCLLGLTYVGLAFATANNTAAVANAPPQQILVALARATLGPHWSLIANWAVALACLTTVMGLAVTFAEIFRKDFFAGRVSHMATIIAIMLTTALFSNLGFAKIMALIHPVVALVYPSIIVLTLCNIAHKLWGWKHTKIPVAATFLVTLIFK